MRRCYNCRHAERDEDWNTLVCKCEDSDSYGDWVDEEYTCAEWAQAVTA